MLIKITNDKDEIVGVLPEEVMAVFTNGIGDTVVRLRGESGPYIFTKEPTASVINRLNKGIVEEVV